MFLYLLHLCAFCFLIYINALTWYLSFLKLYFTILLLGTSMLISIDLGHSALIAIVYFISWLNLVTNGKLGWFHCCTWHVHMCWSFSRNLHCYLGANTKILSVVPVPVPHWSFVSLHPQQMVLSMWWAFVILFGYPEPWTSFLYLENIPWWVSTSHYRCQYSFPRSWDFANQTRPHQIKNGKPVTSQGTGAPWNPLLLAAATSIFQRPQKQRFKKQHSVLVLVTQTVVGS